MARSLTIAAYLAGLRAPERPPAPVQQPPRPTGTIIWARCSQPDQLAAIETLRRKLSEDGDPIHIIATMRHWDAGLGDRALPEPQGKNNIRAFIAHWRPLMAVWVSGDLDPILLAEMRAVDMPAILVDATSDGLDQVAGTWMPGAMRSLLSEFEAVLALDSHSAERLIRAGTPEDTVLITGPMEDCAPTLPCNEFERNDVARAIGTRPVWLAAATHLDECDLLCHAQQFASRRAHRLLLIVVPEDKSMAVSIVEKMQLHGLNVALRSNEPKPSEVTQVYVIDTEEELGLWYRISPITYLGGTLHGGGCRDPFEATALGSAVLYGPHVAPFQRHAARLNAAGASRLIRLPADLGPNVEMLLSTDKTAEIAHAAWDVTSRGASVTNRIAAFILLRVEELAQ